MPAKTKPAAPARPWPSRLRTWAGRAVMGLALLLVAKIVWSLVVVDGDAEEDHTSRTAYVVARVTAPGFLSEGVPGVEGTVFEGEWRLVTLSMTGMALASRALDVPATQPDAERTLARLVALAESRDARDFDTQMWNESALDTLDGPHGHAGYLGHYLLLLDAHRVVGGDGARDDVRRRVADALARRIDASPTAQIETYPGETYTADNSVVVAAIALSDLVSNRPNAHRAVLDRWSRLVRTLRAPTGGIAFAVDREGHATGGARGSALGWSSYYLPYADPILAHEEWQTLRTQFALENVLGPCAVREVADGAPFAGDVDSGPVVFGLSPSGTGFALGGARREHDGELAKGFRLSAEVVGTTVPWGGGRHYWFAPLVGDAILLAMDTARPWDTRFVR